MSKTWGVSLCLSHCWFTQGTGESEKTDDNGVTERHMTFCQIVKFLSKFSPTKLNFPLFHFFLRNFNWRRSGNQRWLSNSLFTTQTPSVSFENFLSTAIQGRCIFLRWVQTRSFPKARRLLTEVFPLCETLRHASTIILDVHTQRTTWCKHKAIC